MSFAENQVEENNLQFVQLQFVICSECSHYFSNKLSNKSIKMFIRYILINTFNYLHVLSIWTAMRYTVNQGSSIPVLEGWCLAEFNSNLNQTHRNKLINLVGLNWDWN